jgi:hypothetical protein
VDPTASDPDDSFELEKALQGEPALDPSDDMEPPKEVSR